MEREIFVSGYCRALDQSRMVAVEIVGDRVDADCAYPDCPYAPGGPVALKIQEEQKNTP